MDQSNQPEKQTPVVNGEVSSLRTKKTKRLIAIISGSLGGLLIIAGVLLYFLWWQSPAKMVEDAVISLFSTEKMTVDGEFNVSTEGLKIGSDIYVTTDSKQSAVKLAVRVEPEDIGEIKLNIDGVMAEDGTIYVKPQGINEAIDVVVDAITNSYKENGATEEQLADIRLALSRSIHDKFDKVIAKAEDRWIKVDPSDLSQSSDNSCYNDITEALKSDKELRGKLTEAYSRNKFISVKDKVESRDGSTGFEIDLNNSESKEKLKSFVAEIKEIESIKKLESCSSSIGDTEDELEKSSNNSSTKFTIWVNNAHKMTAARIEGTDRDEAGTETKVLLDLNFKHGKVDSINIPSDTVSSKEVINALNSASGSASTGF